MADFIFKIAPNIILGSYASSRLGQLVRDWGSRYMVLVDPVLAEFGLDIKIEEALKNRNIDYFCFNDIPAAPNTSVVQQALDLARTARVQGIIAVGGTKAANVGRAVSAFFYESRDIYDFVDGGQPLSASLPLICVPTTIRDAFIFADKSPITDARTRQIKMLKLQAGLCRLAVFDPNLSLTLTENQFTSMTLQTLCFAVEAYISQKANFFSDAIIEKTVDFLACALNDASELITATSKEQFALQGGCMASLGTAGSSIGAGSLISYAINARYSLSRSLTSAILLPYLIEDAAKHKAEKLAKLARIFQAATDGASNEEAVIAFAENIRNKIALAKLPSRLKDLSISMEELALAAEDASQLEYMTSLPRSMTADDLFDIIKQAF